MFAAPNHPYTQALLAEVPRIDRQRRTFVPIKGEIPSPLAPPPGCHFHPRCPYAMPRCSIEVPALREIAPARWSACHLNDSTARFVAMNDTPLSPPWPEQTRASRWCSTRRIPGFEFPADFDAVVSEFDLRDGEDCFVDELYLPATELGVPLLAAQTPRTYLDPNRHAGDIDLELIEGGSWPHTHVPSGKARIGKALIWRTLDDGRAIYGRKLKVDEVLARIDRHHTPYHRALSRRARSCACAAFGVVYHINCHSMNSVAGKMGEGGAGFAARGFRSRRS